MRLSKQRRVIPTWGLENLRFAVIGLPTVKPISPEIEPETMNFPKEWIGSLVCGRQTSRMGMQMECRKRNKGTAHFRLETNEKREAFFFMWGFKESDAGEIENMPSYYFKEHGKKIHTVLQTYIQNRDNDEFSFPGTRLDLLETHEEHFLQLRDS